MNYLALILADKESGYYDLKRAIDITKTIKKDGFLSSIHKSGIIKINLIGMLSESESVLAVLGSNNNHINNKLLKDWHMMRSILSSVSKDELENYRKYVSEGIQKQIIEENLYIRESTIEMLKRWLLYIESKI